MLSFSSVVSFHQKQRQLCETMPYVEQTWCSQQNPWFKNDGTNLDGTKYKSAPEYAENQNNI